MGMMLGWLIGFLGLGVPSLGSGGTTTVQMGFTSSGQHYLAVERATRMNLGVHALEVGVGMIRTDLVSRMYIHGRWDYTRPGFQLTVVGQMPWPSSSERPLRLP